MNTKLDYVVAFTCFTVIFCVLCGIIHNVVKTTKDDKHRDEF